MYPDDRQIRVRIVPNDISVKSAAIRQSYFYLTCFMNYMAISQDESIRRKDET